MDAWLYQASFYLLLFRIRVYSQMRYVRFPCSAITYPKGVVYTEVYALRREVKAGEVFPKFSGHSITVINVKIRNYYLLPFEN